MGGARGATGRGLEEHGWEGLEEQMGGARGASERG